MARRKNLEAKAQYAVLVNGNQIVGWGEDFSYNFNKIAEEYKAMYETDSVQVDGAWTREELEAWVKADVAPAGILEDWKA